MAELSPIIISQVFPHRGNNVPAMKCNYGEVLQYMNAFMKSAQCFCLI